MRLTRWDPLGEITSLRRAMDRLFDESFVQALAAPSAGVAGSVALDMMETEDALVVRASLPGVKPEDLDVSVQGNVLTIEGELRGEQEERPGRFHHRERWYGRFSRQMMLPVEVDHNTCEADFEHGVLTIRLPKSQQARPRRIGIQGAGRTAIEGESRGGQQAALGGQSSGAQQTAPAEQTVGQQQAGAAAAAAGATGTIGSGRAASGQSSPGRARSGGATTGGTRTSQASTARRGSTQQRGGRSTAGAAGSSGTESSTETPSESGAQSTAATQSRRRRSPSS